jgi:hypothetical protein
MLADCSNSYLEALGKYSITCAVCADVKPRPKRSITGGCSHEDSTCTDCIAHIIDMSLNGGNWINLKCPSPQCKQMLKYEDIRFFASPEACARLVGTGSDLFFVKIYGSLRKFRYEKLWVRQSVNEMPDFRYCLANGCKWGQLHPQQSIFYSRPFGSMLTWPGRFPKITCMKCGAESCFTCQIPWHRGMTCAEYKAGANPDKASEEYMRKYCKRCPRRGCGIYIEKDRYCPHLLCEGCKGSFCWECKLLSGHLPTCRASPGTATKPGSDDKRYREGWDEDPGYEGTLHEYSGQWKRIQRRKE